MIENNSFIVIENRSIENCPFCKKVKNFMQNKNLCYQSYSVSGNIILELSKITNSKTVPQIFQIEHGFDISNFDINMLIPYIKHREIIYIGGCNDFINKYSN